MSSLGEASKRALEAVRLAEERYERAVKAEAGIDNEWRLHFLRLADEVGYKFLPQWAQYLFAGERTVPPETGIGYIAATVPRPDAVVIDEANP